MYCLFLVSETGDDVGRTWPKDAKCSAPEIELSVGTVHVASFAFQALGMTNEQMASVSQFATNLSTADLVHASSTSSRGSSS